MNWVGSQIKQRLDNDNNEMSDSYVELAQAVTPSKQLEYKGKNRLAKIAVEKVLAYFNVESQADTYKAASFSEIIDQTSQQYGFLHRTVKLSDKWYKDASGVMIGIIERSDTPVALIPSALSGYRYYDSTRRKYIRVTKRNCHIFKEDAYLFFKPFPEGKFGLRKFMKYLFSFITIPEFLLWLLFVFAALVLTLLIPDIALSLLGTLTYYGEIELMIPLFIMITAATVSTYILKQIKELISRRVTVKMSIGVQTAAMMRIMSLPTSFFKEYSAGDLASRLNLLKMFCEIIIITLSNLIFVLIYALLNTAQWSWYGEVFTAVNLLFIVVIVCSYLFALNIQTKQNVKRLKSETKANSITYEIITGIQKIRLTGSEKRFFSRWSRIYSEAAQIKYSPPKKIIFVKILPIIISLTGTLLLYCFSHAFDITPSAYYAMNLWIGLFLGSVLDLFGTIELTSAVLPGLRLIAPIFDCEPENETGKTKLTSFAGGIEFSNVSFRYDDNSPYVLNNFDLKINNGDYIAIVGKTGSGKSTLLRLMTGFEKPNRGTIYYNGIDAETLDHRALRRQIGIVQQNARLFQGDIYSNITISNPTASHKEVWKAAELAGIADDIRAMPMGMHTIVSADGKGISGGQRQRIVIARALLSKPKVLLLDEATSALDNITQKKVSQTLDSLSCTRIVIAHRLSTIKNCSKIIVLDKGEVVETGSYEELMEKDGFFADLVKRQQLT